MTPSKRRLAAVWFADIVGYTSLSSRDEESALAVVDLFQQVSRQTITGHGGRLVHFIGDAVLADFESTEVAVRAALDLQEQFAAASQELGIPSSLRIGVHVGDVNTTPTGDLFGDGVNTASRLTEQVAQPGQVVVSQDVWRHLKPRTEFHFSPVGQRHLPGISTDVWVFEARRQVGTATMPAAAAALPEPPLGRRIRALLASVAVYGALAFVVLVVGGRIRESLGLPAWTLPAAMFLLAVGLVVIAATSWVQSRPPWEKTVRSQERPWQLGLHEVGIDLAQRRFPELTWPRAIMGGVFAFSLLVIAGWFYVLATKRPPGLLAPRQAYAAPGPGLAVLPFEVEGDEQELWSEGMVDLLSMTMDGAGGLRVIDPRVVVSRWDDAALAPGLASRLELGRRAEASFVVTGAVQAADGQVRISASVYETADGTQLGQAEVGGPVDSLPNLVDYLSRRILALGFAPGGAVSPSRRLGELSTSSPEALQAYLAGEQYFRRSRWHEAELEFRRAVEADPRFALALYRLSMTEAWSRVPHLPRANEWGERAEESIGGLSERDSLLILAYAELSRSSRSALATLEAFTRRYPDDVEGWFLLGDADYHLDRSSPEGERRFRRAFREAIRLDPGFGPAYLHLIDDAVTRGDTAAANATLAEFRRADPGSPLLTGFDWAYALSRSRATEEPEREERSEAAASAAPSRPTPATQTQTTRAPDRSQVDWAGRIAAARAAVEREKRAAFEGSPEVAVGRRWEERTLQAERAEQWPDVIESLARAEEAYRRARPVPEPTRTVAESAAADPPPSVTPRTEAEVSPPPEAIAERTLSAVKRAIEGEDVASLRRIWPGLSAEGARNWQRLFDQAAELRADYVLQEALLDSPQQLTVRVQWTYAYENTGTSRHASHSSSQTLTLRKQGNDWVITASHE